MAQRPDTRAPSVIGWEAMRKKWIWYTSQPSDNDQAKEIVRKFFNTFISQHRGYQFSVVQFFSGLFCIGITSAQYEIIKDDLERKTRLTLPEVPTTEILQGSSITKKSFRNLGEFRKFQDDDLRSRNRKIVERKSKEAKAHYTMVQQAFTLPRDKTILAFDIEVYEYEFNKMLEIGYIVIRFTPGAPHQNQDIEVLKRCQYIIKENLRYKNGNFVPDNRDGFKFGTAHTVRQKEAVELFCKDVKESDFLLGHSVQHDKDYLQKIGVDLSELKKEMLDTQMIQIHKEIKPGNHDFYTPGLKKLLKDYGVSFEEEDLHNAGNDAYYTMMLFLRQMDYSSAFVNKISEGF